MKTLTETQVISVKAQLKESWGITANHWVPLKDLKVNKEAIFFPQDYFFEDFGLKNLKALLSGRSGEVIFLWHWELRKQELFTLHPNELTTFQQDLLEKYYFDDTYDWIIYLSHENTITVGGKELILELKKKWTNWDKYPNQWEV